MNSVIENLSYDSWVENYRPIHNPYFVNSEGQPISELDGSQFSTWDLAQIAGFITEKKIWTLLEDKEVVNKYTGQKRSSWIIRPGVITNSQTRGYVVTKQKYNFPNIVVRLIAYGEYLEVDPDLITMNIQGTPRQFMVFSNTEWEFPEAQPTAEPARRKIISTVDKMPDPIIVTKTIIKK